MDGITHRTVRSNGINIHIAEQGSGPLVLLIHGFPELWYSWHHQISGLAKAGFHVVAPDMRGYGGTDAPSDVHNYTTFHIVGDIVGLIDVLNEEKALVVGHDWGAQIGWDLCLLRPDKVKAYVSLSAPFYTMNSGPKPSEFMKATMGEGFYFLRFLEHGRAEADFSRFDMKTLMKKFLLFDKLEPPIAPEHQEICDVMETPVHMPSWITEDDLIYYEQQFSKSGFVGPLNYYRASDMSWELKAPWLNAKVSVPTLFIIGDMDFVYHLLGNKSYIHDGGFQSSVPNLKRTVVLPGKGHFIQFEAPHDVNKHLISFFKDQYK